MLGFAFGVALASVLLHYDGKQPVNVSWYLFILVFVQLGLALATAVAWGLRRSKAVSGVIRDVSFLSHLIRPLFTKAARYIQRHRLLHIPQDLREGAASRRGLTEAHFALYGPAAYLPFLIAAQVFGIGFNIGVIAITLALEWFTDLAFGWGSALGAEPPGGPRDRPALSPCPGAGWWGRGSATRPWIRWPGAESH